MATFLSKEDRECEDRISGLPDDIILSILSPMAMGMKEAAKTSLLSKRWRNLWTKTTYLDFDYLCMFPQLVPDEPAPSENINKYINWVNQVLGWQQLELHYPIDTFRVCFPLHLHPSEAHHVVDKWVKFAVSRKVKNLELNSTRWSLIYTLGFDILENPSLDITYLTSLHLNNVDVSGEFIEILLSKKCHHLERLYVGRSRILRRLKVIGLVCKLKRLAICECKELTDVEIVDADNLMYFDYVGWSGDTKFVLKNIPMLVEASFNRTCFEPPVSIFQRISHIAPHISKLFLDSSDAFEFPTVLPETLPTFCNLKQLNMVVQYSILLTSVLDIPHLLDACPALQELKLDVIWFSKNSEDQSYVVDAIENSGEDDDLEAYLDYLLSEQPQGKNHPHPNLKRVHVFGFGGCNYEVNTILSIMCCASNLDTIICDSNRFPDDVLCLCNGYDDAVFATSRARAHLFAKIIPPHITLLIM